MKLKNQLFYALFFALSAFAFWACGSDSSTNPDETGGAKITALSSSELLPKMVLKITGSGFGDNQYNNYVTVGSVRAGNVLLWSDKEIDIIVPEITAAGKITVNIDSKESNGYPYTLMTGPYVLAAEDNAAYPEEEITIQGSNFGADNGKVTIGSLQFQANSWSSTEIKATVPADAKSGKLSVTTAAGKKSNDIDFTVSTINDPRIQMINTSEAKVGSEIEITGLRFGDSRGSSYVIFGGGVKAAEYSNWSKTKLVVKVPQGAITGYVRVFVSGIGSNGININVLPATSAPVINSLSKTIFEIGEGIEILGRNFGTFNENTCWVDFNGVKVNSVNSWDDEKIFVTVPDGATSGKVTVYSAGVKSNSIDYTIKSNTTPEITSINPSIAFTGQTVSIEGKNFGAAQGSSYVQFTNAKAVKITKWSDKLIDVVVPDSAKSGEVKVVINGEWSNGVQFKVQSKFQLLSMVLVPSGEFTMGSDKSSSEDYYPAHNVKITRSFYMSKYEITQKEFVKVTGYNPSKTGFIGDNLPVNQLSWVQAVTFCNELSKQEGLEQVYNIKTDNDITADFSKNGYRLPTEAEWEYACRAGSTGDFAGNIGEMGWTNANSGNTIKEVGGKAPNAFGLYDMHGNVAEWVWDWYDIYDSGSATDPKGPATGLERVLRGGYYQAGPSSCTSYIRQSKDPSQRLWYYGFRVVKNS